MLNPIAGGMHSGSNLSQTISDAEGNVSLQDDLNLVDVQLNDLVIPCSLFPFPLFHARVYFRHSQESQPVSVVMDNSPPMLTESPMYCARHERD